MGDYWNFVPVITFIRIMLPGSSSYLQNFYVYGFFEPHPNLLVLSCHLPSLECHLERSDCAPVHESEGMATETEDQGQAVERHRVPPREPQKSQQKNTCRHNLRNRVQRAKASETRLVTFGTVKALSVAGKITSTW